MRIFAGKRITLITDVPASPEIEALPAEFDQAYPQWCAYFGLMEQAKAEWHVNAFLMADKQRFASAGLIPDNLPPFLNGYALGLDLWLNEQPSGYYRRHLLLHEGTHAFMHSLLGGVGPPWYAEGMAELLATHRLVDGRLMLNAFPQRREDVPQLGRIKLVRDAVAAGRLMAVDEVLSYGPTAYRDNAAYAWCWALSAFLDGHPRYRERFRQLPKAVLGNDLNARMRERFTADWADLAEEWQLFAASVEYGHDLVRSAIEYAPGEPLSKGAKQIAVAADRGWQSTRIRVTAGKTYHLRASGRFQIALEPGPPERSWESEPNGVSIRYYGGRPLGLLLAAVHPEPRNPQAASALLKPETVGLETTLRPTANGTLYLRLNDSPAELADNKGSVDVAVSAE